MATLSIKRTRLDNALDSDIDGNGNGKGNGNGNNAIVELLDGNGRLNLNASFQSCIAISSPQQVRQLLLWSVDQLSIIEPNIKARLMAYAVDINAWPIAPSRSLPHLPSSVVLACWLVASSDYECMVRYGMVWVDGN
jgi:hypothetical protein